MTTVTAETYEYGRAQGTYLAENDTARNPGRVTSEREELRHEARVAVEAAHTEAGRNFAAYWLGVARGYRGRTEP